MCSHYKIKVQGKVQGVWFRKYTFDKALELKLRGFVQNESDGSVYVEVEGNDEVLDKFIKWLHTGSPQSSVDKVEIIQKQDCKNLSSFEIRR